MTLQGIQTCNNSFLMVNLPSNLKTRCWTSYIYLNKLTNWENENGEIEDFEGVKDDTALWAKMAEEACKKIFKGILRALRGVSFSCFLLQMEEMNL